jgi:hypothetical protein
LSLGYRQKRPRAAIRFKSCATGQPVDDPSRLLSVVSFECLTMPCVIAANPRAPIR